MACQVCSMAWQESDLNGAESQNLKASISADVLMFSQQEMKERETEM